MRHVLFASIVLCSSAVVPASEPAASQNAQPRLRLGSCLGRGGLEGVRFWGPVEELCNGLSAWGTYDQQVRNVTAVGSCLGRGGVDGVRLYGPVGAACGGFPEWGEYASPVDIRPRGISSCVGHGKILKGHRLWGATGARCGGMAAPEWGVYREFTKFPR